MHSPFSFDALLLFGFLSIMLLAGTFIRAKVSFVQRYLFPSCLLGGILGSILVNAGLIKISATQLETMAYHFFNISFISVGLTRDTNGQAKTGVEKKKFTFRPWGERR